MVTVPDDELLAQRYGRAPASLPKWAWWAGGGVAGILVVALIIWIAAHTMRPAAFFEEIAHTIDSETEVSISFYVNKPADSAATCVVVAENKAHAQVGWKEVEIPASDTKIVRVSTQVATSERASLAKVTSCDLIEQS